MAHQAPGFPKVSPPEANTVQQVVGTFLYYALVIDPTILVALKNIAAEQANSTQTTAKLVTQLLNYSATHSEAITIYHASGMVLHLHSDASFLSYPESKSRSGVYHYISMKSEDPNKAPLNQPPLNEPEHVKRTTMRIILASTMESELGALFVNCQRGLAMRMDLTYMGHAQPPTPSMTDITTGDRFVNDKSSNNVQEKYTYNFIGSESDSGNDNFWYIGWMDNTIWKTISPSITQSAIIG